MPANDPSSLAYTFGYFRELSPLHLELCALSAGLDWNSDRPLNYLELGVGQGVSLAIHAVASGEGAYWGNDYNSEHAEHARLLCDVLGGRARAVADSFEELAARRDLPEFDVIALHGIWTWVRPQDRTTIVEIARRRLAPGGLLYVSYNCSYGWSAAIPLRGLINQHLQTETSSDDSPQQRMNAAFAFANDLARMGASYFRANPTVAAQLNSAVQKNSTYLAHEFFGSHWDLFTLPEVAAALRGAGLEFLTTTFLLEHSDEMLTPEARTALYSLKDPMTREAFKECFINPQFRADVFVKGPAPRLSHAERASRLEAKRFVLTVSRPHVPRSVSGPRGEIALDQETNERLVAKLLERNLAPKSFDELREVVPGQTDEGLTKHLFALVAERAIGVVQSDRKIALARPSCAKLNALILERAIEHGNIMALASPVLGAGVNLGRIHQFMLAARARGMEGPEALAAFALECCDATGEPIRLRGQTLTDPVERRRILTAAASSFSTDALPILRAVGVV